MDFILGEADELPIIQKMYNQIEKWQQVVSAAGFVEFHVVDTSKHQIALENFDLFLGVDVLPGFITNKFFGKTKINQVNLNFPTKFFVNHNIFRLQIVECAVRFVHKLKNRQKLDCNFEDSVKELASLSGEMNPKFLGIAVAFFGSV